ncbi:MAG TPA: ferrous iron transport protein B [Vicinamibacteria bacterium]|jgi:ferrous iron transport protein B
MAAAALPALDLPPRRRPVVLVGNPNVGKSALFGALTGAYATVSNYPGTTVELTEGSAAVGGARVTVIDTPGAASLLPSSEDERVTRDVLLREPVTAVVVADAKNLERGLALTLEVGELGVPLVLCLNMMDEAEERGLGVRAEVLSVQLGVPVVPTVAIQRRGVGRLRAALAEARVPARAVSYAPDVERAAAAVAGLFPPDQDGARALALAVVCGDETLTPWLRARLAPGRLEAMEQVRQDLWARAGRPAYAVARARQREAARLAAQARAEAAGPGARRRFARRLEAATTHRFWGWPILAVALYATYMFVGVLGADVLVGFLEDTVFGTWVNPAAVRAAAALPWAWLRDLLVGPYGVVTMALTYALALILPIVGTFFVAFGALEDSGYLPRLAVMVNRGFRRIGLSGKAVLPMVLGLGCDTMATLTTRILETPKERLMVILLLALGVPCSAQLAVVLGLLSPLPFAALLIWAAVVLGTIVVVGRLASRLLPGRGGDFVLELPPLRLPRPGNVAVKTLARVEWYLKEAVPLFVLGTLLLFGADAVGLLALARAAGEPVVAGLLGLPAEAAEAFIVGFLRRDFGAAGLYKLSAEGRLDPVQTLVSVVVITLFMPCVANFLMIVKERGWRTALAVAGFIVPLAVAVGALLHQVLRLAPGVLR